MTTRFLWLLITAGLAGCAGVMPTAPAGSGGDGVLTGSVTYRERVALPPDAVVEVWIVDATPGPMIQAIVAQTTFATQGRQVPIPFELRYPRARVLSDHHYIVKAVIQSQRQTLFANEDGVAAITQGQPSEVTLRLQQQVRAAPAAGNGGLWGTAWRLEDLAGAGVLDRVEATLEFPEPGKVAGNASCNRFFGSAAVAGASLTFGALGTTRMACAEAVGNQEAKFLRALEGAERFSQQGSTLLVYSRGTDRPLRFLRKER